MRSDSLNSSAKVERLKARKRSGPRIAALTAYDYPMARLLDEADVPLLLVGDSLGMVVLGYPDTTQVTMEDMEHHVRAAARAHPQALLAADLPFGSYETVPQAVANARRLAAAGAEAVKAEGGRKILSQVRAILDDGIPVLGHIGMLPQSVREEGGYRIKGKTAAERETLITDARALVDAGVFAIVLELVTPAVARDLTHAVNVPTIGIGSGPDCDGEILVTCDLLGTFPWFTPRFVKPKLQAAVEMRAAIRSWCASVEATDAAGPLSDAGRAAAQVPPGPSRA
jgi:3-methyl-2-oxobutanoate hydroxymethyltransferase